MPDGEDVSDYLTKPLQTLLFKTMRTMIMNCPIDYIDVLDPAPKSRDSIEDENKKVTMSVPWNRTQCAKSSKR